MFVAESIRDILKPKSREDIQRVKKNLSRQKKESLLFDTGMFYFEGSYTDFLHFLYVNIGIKEWDKIKSIIQSDYSEPIDEEIDEAFLNYYFDDANGIQLILSILSEEKIDKILEKLVPIYK